MSAYNDDRDDSDNSPQPQPLTAIITCDPAHTDRKHIGRGKCRQCYEKWRREQAKVRRAQDEGEERARLASIGEVVAEREDDNVPSQGTAPAQNITVDDDLDLDLDLDTLDDTSKKKFVRIMWGWIHEVERARKEIWVQSVDGALVRDYKTETRRTEIASALAAKAATVLGRHFVGEKVVDNKPEMLPLEGVGAIMAGWQRGVAAQSLPVIDGEVTERAHLGKLSNGDLGVGVGDAADASDDTDPASLQ